MNPQNRTDSKSTQSTALAQLPKNDPAVVNLQSAVARTSGLLHVLGGAFAEDISEAAWPHFASVAEGIQSLIRDGVETLQGVMQMDAMAAENTISEACALVYLFGGALTNSLNSRQFKAAGSTAAGVDEVAFKNVGALHAGYYQAHEAMLANR